MIFGQLGEIISVRRHLVNVSAADFWMRNRSRLDVLGRFAHAGVVEQQQEGVEAAGRAAVV